MENVVTIKLDEVEAKGNVEPDSENPSRTGGWLDIR